MYVYGACLFLCLLWGLCWCLWECLLCSGCCWRWGECVLRLGVLKYAVCLCGGWGGCCVLCLNCEAWSCRCSCMESVSVSSYICCMIVSCVHPVAVLNAAFCMTWNLLMPVEDAWGDHIDCYVLSRQQL